MTINEIKNIEIILHMKGGERLYGETRNEEVIDCIATNISFRPVIGEFSPEERAFTELIQNENK